MDDVKNRQRPDKLAVGGLNKEIALEFVEPSNRLDVCAIDQYNWIGLNKFTPLESITKKCEFLKSTTDHQKINHLYGYLHFATILP